MKLWELLRRRMLEHGEAVAFADAGVSYAELVRAAEEGEFSFGGRLICAEGESKLAQAVQILKILAHGGVAVPVSEYYDPSAAAAVRKLAAKDCGSTTISLSSYSRAAPRAGQRALCSPTETSRRISPPSRNTSRFRKGAEC